MKRRSVPMSPIALTPPDKRPPGASKGFMVKPGTLARGEQLLLRELKILEWQIKTKQIDGPEAKRRGHQILERHYEGAIREVELESEEQDLGEVDRGDSELQKLLRKTKRDWTSIVDELLAL